MSKMLHCTVSSQGYEGVQGTLKHAAAILRTSRTKDHEEETSGLCKGRPVKDIYLCHFVHGF